MNVSPAPKKRSATKIFLSLLATVIAILVVLTALMPTIASSSWGRERLLSTLNEVIPGELSIKNISMNWFGPQKIEGVALKDPEGSTVITLDSATINTSLFKMLANPSDIGTFDFKAFNANIVTDSDGNTNLMRALNEACCAPREASPLQAVLKNVNGQFKIASRGSPFNLKISGETLQGTNQGKFNIDAELVGFTTDQLVHGNKDLADLIKDNPNADLKVNADVTNFPVELLDQVVALKAPQKAGLLLKALGPQINMNITQKTIPEGVTLQITANSPTLKASADVAIGKDITLAKPAAVILKVRPELIQQFFKSTGNEKPWKLSSETTANLTINKLNLPLSALTQPLDKIDSHALVLNANLDVAEANLLNESHDINMTVKGVRAAVNAEANTPLAAISLTADAVNNQQPMKVNINATIPKEVFWRDLTTLNLKDLLINGQISGAPLFVLNQNDAYATLLSELAGPKADISFSLKDINGRHLATLDYNSERLQIPNIQLWIGQNITLHEPVEVVAKIPPTLINQPLKDVDPRLQNPVMAKFVVKSLSLPSAALHEKGPRFVASLYKMHLDADLSLSIVKMIQVPTVGKANIHDFNLHIAATPNSRPELTLKANVQPDGPGKLYDLLGKRADMSLIASLGIGLDGKPTLTVFNFNVDSDLCRAEMSGKMIEGHRLVLNSPAVVSYTLTAAGLNTLGLTAADNFHFGNASPLEITIDTSHIPLNPLDVSMLKLGGQIKVNGLQVQPKVQRGLPQATLDNLVANWNIDAAANKIDLDFTGITLLGQQEAAGKLHGKIAINGWHQGGDIDFSDADMRIKTVASNLPTEFMSSLSNGHDYVAIFGNSINIDLLANISAKAASSGSVDIELSSENLTGSIALAMGDVIKLSTSRPTEFRLNLTPQGYDAIRQIVRGTGISDFHLIDTAKATFKVTSLNLPSDGTLLQAGLTGNYIVERLVGEDSKTRNRLSIQSMQGNVSSHNISDHVDFDMAARGQTGQGSPTSWAMNGALDKGFTSDGAINKDNLSLQFDATIETLPISLLCQFICVDQSLRNKFEALIGPTLNARVKAQLQRMNGPFFVDLQGKNGHLNVDATVANGYLTLNKALTAQVAVTPQLSRYVLADLIPIISGMLAADHPIRLTIDPQGFALPLNNPSTTNIAIGAAALELGRVSFSNSSQLAKVLSLLTPSNTDQFMVWLTPAYFSLNQGVLNLGRVDMLISDSYPIAAWGNVDLGKERVHMTIGLSGAAIQRAFSVSGLPRSYFLQIPLRGRLDSPSFDKTKAAARLSSIVAQTQGGPQGMVIGTVIDIASGGLSEPPPPPPTTNPLPWAEMMTDPPGSEKKTIDKQVMKPIEDVGKGAQQLLKKLFK